MPDCCRTANWDHALGLTDTGANTLADVRTGRNGRHRLPGLLRQSVFGRPAGYEDVNDADRMCRDPAMRWVVGDRAITGPAASASQMGRFETKWLCRPENLAALARTVDRQSAPAAPAEDPDCRMRLAVVENTRRDDPGLGTAGNPGMSAKRASPQRFW